MTNPYPANFETPEGTRRLTGQVNFTDPANQPGGGGGLPSQWTVGSNGEVVFTTDSTAVTPVTIQAPTGKVGGFLFELESFGGQDAILVRGGTTDGTIGAIDISSDAALNLTGGPISLNGFTRVEINPGTGIVNFGPNAATPDGTLQASSWSLWLDDTVGATKLMIKAKDSGGTVRTATIPLI